MYVGGLKKNSCSEFAETCSRFGNFEIQQIFFPVAGGGSQKKVAQNLLKHSLALEFSKSDKKKIPIGGGGGFVKKKSCSECAETCSGFGFFEIRQKNLLEVKKFNRQTP